MCIEYAFLFWLFCSVPAFLAVNAIYGAEVTKELSPLWIVGPLIVAFYIKTFLGLCALYAFCFNQTTKVIRNLPSYYIIAYHYTSHGKLKDDLRALVTRPIVAIKNTDYRQLTRTKLKQVQEWIIEIYLNFVESIWPYYCRTIRFLKRANFIWISSTCKTLKQVFYDLYFSLLSLVLPFWLLNFRKAFMFMLLYLCIMRAFISFYTELTVYY